MKFWMQSQITRMQFAWVNRKKLGEAVGAWLRTLQDIEYPAEFWQAINPAHLKSHEEFGPAPWDANTKRECQRILTLDLKDDERCSVEQWFYLVREWAENNCGCAIPAPEYTREYWDR